MDEKKIIVTSTNPSKIEAVRNGFSKLFPDVTIVCTGISVPSGVQEQPMTSEETLFGAAQRITAARKTLPNADFYFGIEGGVHEGPLGLHAFNWVVVETADKSVSQAQSAQWILPLRLADGIRSGMKMSEAVQKLSINEQDIITTKQRGLIGLATDGVLDRLTWCEQAVIIALIPLKNPKWYS